MGNKYCLVNSSKLIFNAAPSSYSSEISSSATAWDSLNKIDLISTSSQVYDVKIVDKDLEDVAWKGETKFDTSPGQIWLNSYYLDQDPTDEKLNTIMHEMGHALGLTHSFTGNIMYYNQTAQSTFGSQDLNDFNYIWP